MMRLDYVLKTYILGSFERTLVNTQIEREATCYIAYSTYSSPKLTFQHLSSGAALSTNLIFVLRRSQRMPFTIYM